VSGRAAQRFSDLDIAPTTSAPPSTINTPGSRSAESIFRYRSTRNQAPSTISTTPKIIAPLPLR